MSVTWFLITLMVAVTALTLIASATGSIVLGVLAALSFYLTCRVIWWAADRG